MRHVPVDAQEVLKLPKVADEVRVHDLHTECCVCGLQDPGRDDALAGHCGDLPAKFLADAPDCRNLTEGD